MYYLGLYSFFLILPKVPGSVNDVDDNCGDEEISSEEEEKSGIISSCGERGGK